MVSACSDVSDHLIMLTRGNCALALSKHLSSFIESLCFRNQSDVLHIIQDLLKDVNCILKGIIVAVVNINFIIFLDEISSQSQVL